MNVICCIQVAKSVHPTLVNMADGASVRVAIAMYVNAWVASRGNTVRKVCTEWRDLLNIIRNLVHAIHYKIY